MEKNKLDTKTIRKYWRQVLRRAIEPVLGELAMRAVGVLFVLVLAVFVISTIFTILGIVSAPFLESRIEDLKSIVSTSFYTLAVMSVLVLIGIYRTAPEMYNELGGFIEIPFDIKTHAPYPKNTGEQRWASIDIINTSSFVVEKCYVEINSALDAKKKSVIDMPRNLKWSWGHGEENRTKELEILHSPKVCDIAVALPDYNVMLFETWSGQNLAQKGVYALQITVHGLWKGLLRSKSFDLILEYKGSNIITVRQRYEKEWANENPKPKKLRISAKKLPYVSDNSSS